MKIEWRTLKIPPYEQSHLANNVLSFLCTKTHALDFISFLQLSPFQHINIQKREHIYTSREQNASICPGWFSQPFFFCPQTLPSWKTRKYFHWIKVSLVLKQLAWIQPEPILKNFISTFLSSSPLSTHFYPQTHLEFPSPYTFALKLLLVHFLDMSALNLVPSFMLFSLFLVHPHHINYHLCFQFPMCPIHTNSK